MLKLLYDNQSDIPAGFESLYTERDGKWHLTGVEGIKTPADVDNVNRALTNERTAHATTKRELAAYKTAAGDRSPEDLHTVIDSIPELETRAAANGGKVDQAQIDALVNSKVAPIQRKLDAATAQINELTGERDNLSTNLRSRDIRDRVRDVLVAEKVVPSAMDDALMYAERQFEVLEDGSVVTRDGSGVTPGLAPKDWLTDLKKTKSHWWPASEGAGLGPNGMPAGGDNPWSKAGWNLTKQGQVVTLQGQDVAERMAKAAGSKVGATAPPER